MGELPDDCIKWVKEKSILKNIPVISLQYLRKYVEINLKDRRSPKLFIVAIYPENTEYLFAKEMLTNTERPDSLAHWFPVFELKLD